MRYSIYFALAASVALSAGCNSSTNPQNQAQVDEPAYCGNMLDTVCPEGQVCADDPSDDCDENLASHCPMTCQPELIDDGCGAQGNCDDSEDDCTCDEDCDAGESCQNGDCVSDDDNTCDPDLACGDALTCVDGLLYPTTCGPTNCSEPIGPCDDGEGACTCDEDCDAGESCTGGFCVADDETNEAVSLIIDGEERTVTTFTDSLINGDDGQASIRLEVFSDPIPLAIDDEITIVVTLEIEDRDALVVGQPISIGQNEGDLVRATFDYLCFCVVGGPADGQVTGTVTFDIISENRLRGVADLSLQGSDPDGTDFGEVELFAPFDAQ